jgi:fatty acid-binding protein DegV
MIRDDHALEVEDVIVNYVDPVIGAHSGPGTLALFYMAKSRD